MCKFYISALVGIIIEWLDDMHGVTMNINTPAGKFLVLKLVVYIAASVGPMIKQFLCI